MEEIIKKIMYNKVSTQSIWYNYWANSNNKNICLLVNECLTNNLQSKSNNWRQQNNENVYIGITEEL